ncbi:hypothetical protein F5B22DRAFT_658277 [Xylaria bambusicola]|uniref:uncharacterized protein n=1 Tax=Xylaria bambusicola TaxID=326684 RepID=UPI00200863CE|nr:uncharacterized protein F5B22DRAFT_658277 [Xylaria bambusicola]KAI0525433.1 hypothetical protein F5B22DRAFT_658277 [Xylaria bambusicola]
MSTKALSVRSDHSHVDVSLQSLICPKCNVKYPNIHELLTHQAAERHFSCDQCCLCFWSEVGLRDHKRKNHRPEIDLECFGCQSHFIRAGLFWEHLESGKCSAIYPSDLVRLREKNLEFAKQLERRRMKLEDMIPHEDSHIKGEENTWASNLKEDTAPVPPVVTPDFPSRPAPISAENAHPLYYRSEDFPVLPTNPKGSTAPNPRDEKKKDNAWSTLKATVFQTPSKSSVSYNAVPPPVLYDSSTGSVNKNAFRESMHNDKIRLLQIGNHPAEEGPHDATSNGLIINPDHPDYNPAVYYNELLEKFVCPYKICKKKFYDVFSLTRHLQSPAHAGGRISCICCKKSFTTVANLITHMEMATTCPIRDTDGFRRALGQITGGILDFHSPSGIFFIDDKSVQELLKLRTA